MLIKIEELGNVEFKKVNAKQLLKETKELYSISASGMWDGEKTVTLVLFEDNLINKDLASFFLDDITKQYLIKNYNFTRKQLDEYTEKQNSSEGKVVFDDFMNIEEEISLF